MTKDEAISEILRKKLDGKMPCITELEWAAFDAGISWQAAQDAEKIIRLKDNISKLNCSAIDCPTCGTHIKMGITTNALIKENEK